MPDLSTVATIVIGALGGGFGAWVLRAYMARAERDHIEAGTARRRVEYETAKVDAALDASERITKIIQEPLEHAQTELERAQEELKARHAVIADLREEMGREAARRELAERALDDALNRQRVLDAEIVMLRASGERDQMIRGMLDHSPDALLLVNEYGVIVASNARADEMFRRGALGGLPVDKLVPERFQAQHGEHRESYMRHPTPRPMGLGRELSALRGDGTEIEVEIGLAPYQRPDGQPGVIASVRDMTDRPRT